MQYSTVTHKGQVTIPVDLRRAFGIKEGDKVGFVKTQEGIALTAVRRVKLSALCGYLPKPKKALSIEEINRIIEDKK